MAEFNIQRNPNSETTSPDRHQQFVEFNKELIDLVRKHGYNSYLITVEDPQPPVLMSTAVQTERLATAEQMRRKANQTVDDFIRHAVRTVTQKGGQA